MKLTLRDLSWGWIDLIFCYVLAFGISAMAVLFGRVFPWVLAFEIQGWEWLWMPPLGGALAFSVFWAVVRWDGL